MYGHVITKFSGMGRFTYPWCSAGALRAPELRYKVNHSTEMAFEIKVPNDILRAIDDGNSVILLLLDISAAFDIIAHEILMQRLYYRYGIAGKVYESLKSYLTERSFTVQVAKGESSKLPLD